MNPLARLEEIEADIAEAERLMTALRLKIAVYDYRRSRSLENDAWLDAAAGSAAKGS